MGTTIDRTAEEAKSLLSALQQKFPSKTLGEDRWYILAVRFFLSSICFRFAFEEKNNLKKRDESVTLTLVFIPSSSPSSLPANANTRPHCTPTSSPNQNTRLQSRGR